MKVLLALEQTRISEGAIRILSRMTLPGGSDLFLLYVNPLPRQIMGLAKKRDAKISQQVHDVQKNVLEQARQFLDKVENRLCTVGLASMLLGDDHNIVRPVANTDHINITAQVALSDYLQSDLPLGILFKLRQCFNQFIVTV